MAELPQGTVTFLFTDIEGSTRLLQELGDRYAGVLLDHRTKLREVFDRNRGVEVGTEGDSFFVAFTTATDATTAAKEAQQALAGGPVRVRMGIHTGEPLLVAGDYVGIDVHRAARICSAAHGGQIVASDRTRAFLPAGDEELHDLGLHRLKDLTAAERLYQVGPGSFPPLRSLGTTNLPTQPAPLIGRRREIDELTALATKERVVTLTGPGGTGKTRLGLQVAAELVDHFPDGVFWAPLAGVRDPELVLPTISGAIGSHASLEEHLGPKKTLLLLDNMEQVLGAASHLADLTRRCANLHLLTTSRAPLRIEGEHEYAVDPLPEEDAVALFFASAAPATADLGTGDSVVGEICRRLDRLPLAVELAAARTRIFSPQQLLERLGERLPLLTGGRRDLPERQRTLRAAIEWSYELLTPEARELFARLGVFVGSFDLAAAEQVCDASLDALETLVEESLVRHRDDRFSMLETIREFAWATASGSDSIDATELRERHARYFLDLAERAELEGSEVATWIRRLGDKEDNLRAALGWATSGSADREDALRMCIALTKYWEMAAQLEEGLRWYERALSLPGEVTPRVHAEALRELGTLLMFANRPDESIARLTESVALWRSLDDPIGLSGALRRLAMAVGLSDPAGAEVVLAETLSLSSAAGDRAGERVVLHLLGEHRRDAGAFDEAAELFSRSIEIAREMGGAVWVGATMHSWADLELDRGDLTRATELYRSSLQNAVDRELTRHKVYCLAGLAAVAARRGRTAAAARLWAGVERAERELQFRLLEKERARYERLVSDLPDDPSPPGLDEALALALSDAV